MSLRAVSLSVLLLLAAVPAGNAESAAQPAQSGLAPSLEQASDAARCNPPCGYIVPTLDLEFPGKANCRAKSLGGPVDLSECIVLPAVGERHVEQGFFRVTWDITQDGTYPADPTQPIVVSFSGTSSNPKFVSLSIEPQQVTLDAVALANPQNTKTEGDRVHYWYEVPITATFERTEEGADEKSVKRVDRSKGVVQVFLKAKSSASGEYFRESFATEEFRFNPCQTGDALATAVAACYTPAAGDDQMAAPQESPAWGFIGMLAVLAGLAIVRRRA